MNINLLGNLEDRTEKITELLDLERKSFLPCNIILEKLPHIDCLSVDFLNNEPLGDDKISPLSKSEKAVLLVSDLCDNQRISLNMLIQLQDEDANIRKFKENLVEKKKLTNTL